MTEPHTREERHVRFTQLVRDFYIEVTGTAPAFESDADTAIAFPAHVDDAVFTIGYDPLAGDACLFIWCELGEVHAADEVAQLRWLLARNVELARNLDATCCVDPVTRQVALYARRNVEHLDAARLQGELGRLARLAQEWRGNGFTDGHASHASAPPWALAA